MSSPRPKLLYLVTEDWYFWSHRLALARAAQGAGYDVVVATRVNALGDAIRAEGFGLAALGWRRRSRNPFRELLGLNEIIRLYRREKPDIVHHIAMKPVVLGTIAARLSNVPTVINGIMGLGFAFSLADEGKRVWRTLLGKILARILVHPSAWFIFQNSDDREVLCQQLQIAAAQATLIRGSGVDIERFNVLEFPSEDQPTVAVVSRMIGIKGIDTVIAAHRAARNAGAPFRLLLAGEPDSANPTSFTAAQLSAWDAEPGVEWLGRVDDVRTVWRQAHIAVLVPRGGEGVPLSLIEAAACGRPTVATDVPGCREIVVPGKNGILVPPNNSGALADAIGELARDVEMRARFAAAGRIIVGEGFSERSVVTNTLAFYDTARSA